MMMAANRMAQYKNCGRIEKMRDQLRKNCLDRLRARRNNVIDLKRSMHERVDTVIREVLADKPVSEEFGLEMLEQLKAQLLQDELDEFIAWENARIEAEYEAHLRPQEVFCPACMKNVLSFHVNSISCANCKFSHIFTSSKMPSQSRLCDWLSQVCTAHAEKCTAPIAPIENSTPTGAPLILECDFCSAKAVMDAGCDVEVVNSESMEV